MNQPDDWREQARALADRGDHEAACRIYAAQRAQDPECEEAWLGEGRMRVEMEELDQALECFSQALMHNPDLLEARQWVGRLENMLQAPPPAPPSRHAVPTTIAQPEQDPEDRERQDNLRQHRRLRKVRRYLTMALLALGGILLVLVALTLPGMLQGERSLDARPALPTLADGLQDYTGVLHYLVPGVMLRVEQQADRAYLSPALTLEGLADEDIRLACSVRDRTAHSGTFYVRFSPDGWGGDVSLGRAVIAQGVERAHSQAEVDGWSALDRGEIDAARRHFLRAPVESAAVLAGLLSCNYAEGSLQGVMRQARRRAASAELAQAPLTRDYLLHLSRSARNRLRTPSNAMPHIQAALLALPAGDGALSPALQRVFDNQEPLMPSLHRMELATLQRRYHAARQALRPTLEMSVCYLVEEFGTSRLEAAVALQDDLVRLEGLARALVLNARLEQLEGEWERARDDVMLTCALGCHLLRAGLAGQHVLGIGLAGARMLLHGPHRLDREQLEQLRTALARMERNTPWDEVLDSQTGNLAAIHARAREMRDDDYHVAQRVALADLRLTWVSAAVRIYELTHGTLPNDLAESGLDDEAIRDPFGEGALGYRSGGTSALLYSVGPDGLDGGGERPLGGSAANPRSGDILLRLVSRAG